MSSLQEPAGGSKSLKFVDGLQAMFQSASLDDDSERVPEVATTPQTSTTRSIQHPSDEPQMKSTMRYASARTMAPLQGSTQILDEKSATPITVNNNDNSYDSSDSEFDDLLEECDDDPVLAALRLRRLQEFKEAQAHKAKQLARGQGEYRTISQDEFLPECCSSEGETASEDRIVVVHFFLDSFERCKIMDHHLGMIAVQHAECKFVRINAEKAPFFVTKLKVRTLPTLLVLRNGIVTDRLTGFDGLANSKSKEPDVWETSKLQEWLSKANVIDYKAPIVSDDDDNSDASSCVSY